MPRHRPTTPDPESFDRALAVLDGARWPLDPASAKMLRLLLTRGGCDARLSVERFVVTFGGADSPDEYHQRAAPAAVSALVELLGAAPGARAIRGVIGPVSLRSDVGLRPLDRRRVWIDADPSELRIQVRDRDGADDTEVAPPLPVRIAETARIVELEAPRACPHCGMSSSTYRRLGAGWFVCGACARSFPPT